MPLGSIGRIGPATLTGIGGVGGVPADWGGRFADTLHGAPLPPVDATTWPTYRDRPVFQWEIDWATSPSLRIDVQIDDVKDGFGDVFFWKDQQHVIHGWDVGVPLADQEIADCDRFFDELHGRRAGFWFQTPTLAFRITSGISLSKFDVVDRDNLTALQGVAELHLSFTKQGQTTMRAKVTDIVSNGDGTERVTVTPNLDGLVDSTWKVWVLAYVRLSDDMERGKFEADGRLYRSFKVIELPHEYAAYDFGEKPVILYLFEATAGALPVRWRQTSYGLDFDDGTDVWTRSIINHGAIRRSIDAGREEVEVRGLFESGSPFYQLVPPALAMPLWVTIYRTTVEEPTEKTTLFTGQIVGPVEIDGRTVKAKAASILDIGVAQVPGLVFQPRCNYRVYQPDTCRLSEAAWDVDITITAMANRTVTVTGAGLVGKAEDYFAEGFLEVGEDSELERRTILASTAESAGAVVLTLNMALRFAGLSTTGRVLPGCDGTPDTCIVKFANFRNFGGHRFAFRNLAIKGLDTPTVDAAKK